MSAGKLCKSGIDDKTIKKVLRRKKTMAQYMVDINISYFDILYIRQNVLKTLEKRAKIAIAFRKISAYNEVWMSI